MKIVIDSSVWIAGIGSNKGYASKIIDISYKIPDVEIFITNKILDEIALNLEKKFKFDRTLAINTRRIIKSLCDFEIDVDTKEKQRVRAIRYDPDKYILALCKKIQADYLITFDHKHLLSLKNYNSTLIIEPKAFSKILNENYR